jgi:hypothetical protein
MTLNKINVTITQKSPVRQLTNRAFSILNLIQLNISGMQHKAKNLNAD